MSEESGLNCLRKKKYPGEKASQQELFIHFASVSKFALFPSLPNCRRLSVQHSEKTNSQGDFLVPSSPTITTCVSSIFFHVTPKLFPFLRPKGFPFLVFLSSDLIQQPSRSKKTKTSANKLQRIITHWGALCCWIVQNLSRSVCWCPAQRGDPHSEEEAFLQKIFPFPIRTSVAKGFRDNLELFNEKARSVHFHSNLASISDTVSLKVRHQLK